MLSKCFAQENSANREELNLVAQPMMVGGAMGSGVATSPVVFPGPIQPLLPATKPSKKFIIYYLNIELFLEIFFLIELN